MEEALMDSVVNPENPVKAGRIIRAFDPCLSCATHVITADSRDRLDLHVRT
ncbi:MAG TPA: nickel-dependent hydrogenase large subunit [Bacillota bacterium]|nr:nickel-dependent hydrogenase large subunit [Bacillota bacterium]